MANIRVNDKSFDSVQFRRLSDEQCEKIHNGSLEILERTTFDVVLLDLNLGGLDGLAVMRHIKQHWPHTEIIIATAYASLDSAIEAVRQGAFDYNKEVAICN